jgi:hypothetical protein
MISLRKLRVHLNFQSVLIVAAILILSVSGVGRVEALTIGIDLGEPATFSSDTTVPFEDLNGTSLLGQTLSLDFLFADNEFVRLFTLTGGAYSVGLSLQTNLSGFVGFLDGMGFLMDDNGAPLHTQQDLGSASADDGRMFVGLFPFLSGELVEPFDHYGVHFDLTFPENTSVEVIGGQFRAIGFFGIGPGLPPNIVPESATMIFLASGFLGLAGFRRKFRKR